MTSPLVTRLITDINSCVYDDEMRALYVAELACYWARTGEFDEAERLRTELREKFGDGRSAQVSIFVMCLESLLLYFKDLSPQARDRMLRANLLSKSFHQHRLAALTSAWMAHIDFNQNRFKTMAENLVTCSNALNADDGAAECRASLVLGDAFLFAGDPVAAKAWYDKARRIATAAGDHAAIGAMTYNRAALRVSAARLQNVVRPVAADETSLINTEVNSAINYQTAARLKSLDHLLGTAKAGVLMLRHEYVQAKALIEDLLMSGYLAPGSSQEGLLKADLMLIDARSGQLDKARAWLGGVEQSASNMTADDRTLILSTASLVAGTLDDRVLEAEFSSAAKKSFAEHDCAMQDLLQLLTPFRRGTFSSETNTGL